MTAAEQIMAQYERAKQHIEGLDSVLVSLQRSSTIERTDDTEQRHDYLSDDRVVRDSAFDTARSTASSIRVQIGRGGERLWRHNDFRGSALSCRCPDALSPDPQWYIGAVEQRCLLSSSLDCLRAKPSNPTAIKKLAGEQRRSSRPALPPLICGVLARKPCGEASWRQVHSAFPGSSSVLRPASIARRSEAWKSLSETEAALLDFLRKAGKTSELSAERTLQKTLGLMSTDRHLERLLKVADSEPTAGPRPAWRTGRRAWARARRLKPFKRLLESALPVRFWTVHIRDPRAQMAGQGKAPTGDCLNIPTSIRQSFRPQITFRSARQSSKRTTTSPKRYASSPPWPAIRSFSKVERVSRKTGT
jgi:hypothetical protein